MLQMLHPLWGRHYKVLFVELGAPVKSRAYFSRCRRQVVPFRFLSFCGLEHATPTNEVRVTFD